jgi:D-arabinose 1-dehydrogenase-like Zn-dependent alcohol dehydrogenase
MPNIVIQEQLDGKTVEWMEKSVTDEQRDREYLYEALDCVAKWKVKIMTETFPLDDVADAYDRVASGKVRLRAVVTMNYRMSFCNSDAI